MAGASILPGQLLTANALNLLPPSISLATGSTANTNTEQVIGTFTIPANDPAAVAGSGFLFRVYGSADDVSTPLLTLRMRINGVAGSLYGNQPGALSCRTATGMGWSLDGWFFFTAGGASSAIDGNAILNESLVSGIPALHPNLTFGPSNPATFDTTVAWTLNVTAIWGTASASNIARTLAGGLYRI